MQRDEHDVNDGPGADDPNPDAPGPQEKTDPEADHPFADAELIHGVSRKQAIEDGLLVDLSDWAKEVGFHIPVACTLQVWLDWIVPPEGTRELGQSERGRGHDLLWMCSCAIRRARSCEPSDRLNFEAIFLQSANVRRVAELKVICGPGDDGEPVLTILERHED